MKKFYPHISWHNSCFQKVCKHHALGVVESFGGLWFGPEHATTLSFLLLIVVLLVKPTGLLGRKGYE